MRPGIKIGGLTMLSMGVGMLLIVLIPQWGCLVAISMVIAGIYFLLYC